jgi:hypothetical protein
MSRRLLTQPTTFDLFVERTRPTLLERLPGRDADQAVIREYAQWSQELDTSTGRFVREARQT